MLMSNSRIIFLTAVVAFVLIACNQQEAGNKAEANSEPAQVDTSKKSIPSETTKKINDATITIKYHAPAVRGRVIWGGLVAYDNVWVAGAHKATSLQCDKDFMVGDTRISAGKYAIFTIPAKDEWTFIINKNWDQHLADEYSEKEDVVRLAIKPTVLQEPVERLRYEIDQAGERRANIEMSWEKLRLTVPIRIME
jgi:flagellar biosynthesis component FlhA